MVELELEYPLPSSLPAVRLKKDPKEISRVPFDQKSEANKMPVILIVNSPVFVKSLTIEITPPA